MTTKCLPRSEKNQPKISFFMTSEKENPWSEDETDTGTTTEANEHIEVDDDISHEASENKEQGKFQSRWASLYTWLTYDKDKNKMYCNKCISICAMNICGMKQKLRISRNKISMQIPVTGAQCTIVWAIRDGNAR
jgi:hypothetical protein